MDEITHTIMPGNTGWGGPALGAGVGGLLGSWLGNGGFGGLGYRGAGAAVGYDTGALNGIQQTVNGIQQQIASADRDLLIQTSGQNQFLGILRPGSSKIRSRRPRIRARPTSLCARGSEL